MSVKPLEWRPTSSGSQSTAYDVYGNRIARAIGYAGGDNDEYTDFRMYDPGEHTQGAHWASIRGESYPTLDDAKKAIQEAWNKQVLELIEQP